MKDQKVANKPIDEKGAHAYLSVEVASHVLWFFRKEGYQPGSFVEMLLLTISRADIHNQMRLALGFPEYAFAMQLAQNHSDGLEILRKIAKGQS